MQIESFENALLLAVNPVLKSIIEKFDVDCEQDGNLLENSLKDFFGENVKLCRHCENLNRKLANPLFEISTKLLRVDKKLIKGFLDQDYCDAWLKGITLVIRGGKKYGIQIPFIPAGPAEVVWNFTYSCNLRCKHCYENAGFHRPELTTEQACMAIDKLSNIAGVGLPALFFAPR